MFFKNGADVYLSILARSSETEVSNMGSPSPLARPRAIFTDCGGNTKKTAYVYTELNRCPFPQCLCSARVKQLLYYLCNPVVGAVPGLLASNVVALQDIEGSDKGDTCMWGWGRHHLVSLRKKTE